MPDSTIGGLTPNAAVLTTHKFPIEPVGGPPAEYNTIAQLITLLNTIYAPITGGAYVLKAGDTMTGPLLFSPDNTVDIGASGATRARTGYFGTSLVTALVASPAATALSFASAGTTRANFSTAGHLLFIVNNTYDIGSTGINDAPRNVYVGTTLSAGQMVSAGTEVRATTNVRAGSASTFNWLSRSALSSPSDGVITLTNAAIGDFGRLQFGGTTSAFPAIKRSGTGLEVKLADDSAYTVITASMLRLTPALTVATLPAAGTQGRIAYVTDALAPAFLAIAVGGGGIITTVFDNGTNWVSV